ncbi:hypothetical protein PHIN7_01960 [Polynucleobacter sp. HIN7]|nr:hypothetical protein PHIN7_01960 [Polynucleobacter sp. HIN7]
MTRGTCLASCLRIGEGHIAPAIYMYLLEKRQICNKNTRYSGFESFWILSIGKYFKLGKLFFSEFISNFPIFDRNEIFKKAM